MVEMITSNPNIEAWILTYCRTTSPRYSLLESLLLAGNHQLRHMEQSEQSQLMPRLVERYSRLFVNPLDLNEVLSHGIQTIEEKYRTRPANLYIIGNGIVKNFIDPTVDDYGVIYYDTRTGCSIALHETWIDEVRGRLQCCLSRLRPCYLTRSEWKYVIDTKSIPSITQLGISPTPSNIYLSPDDPNQIYSVKYSELPLLKDAKIQYKGINLAVEHSNIVAYKDYRSTLEQFGIHTSVFKSGSLRTERVDSENIIAWDIEAFTDSTGEFVPYCLCTSTNETYWGTDCVERFVGRLLTISSEPASDIYFIAHNGSGFDHLFLLREFLRVGIVPWVIIVNDRLYGLDYKHLHFRDSCLMYPSRLAEFCRVMGSDVQKGQFDHEKVNQHNFEQFREESSKYCLQDCISLRQAWEIYRDKLWRLCKFEITGQYSINAACYNLFASRYMSTDITTSTRTNIENFRSSNYPATIYLCSPGVYTGEIKLCKLSSLYITAMQEIVPTSFRVHRTGSQFGLIVDHYLYFVRKISFPEGEMVNLPVSSNDGVVYPREQFNQLRWGIELKMAVQLGAQFECDEWYEFNDAPIFREYSTVIGEADSTIRELFCKRLKHKFEQHITSTKKIVQLDEIKQLVLNHRTIELQPMMSNYFLATIDQYSPAEPSQLVHIASYLNAAIRSMLCRLISTIGRERVLCCGRELLIAGNVPGLEIISVERAIVLSPATYGYITTNGEQHVVIEGIPRVKTDQRFDFLQRLAEGYQLSISWDEFHKECMTGVRLIRRTEKVSFTSTPVGTIDV